MSEKDSCFSCNARVCETAKCTRKTTEPTIFLENVIIDEDRKAIIKRLLQFLMVHPTTLQIEKANLARAQTEAATLLPHLENIHLSNIPSQPFAGDFSAYLGRCDYLTDPVGIFLRMTASTHTVARWLLQLKNASFYNEEQHQIAAPLPPYQCDGSGVDLKNADNESISKAAYKMLNDIAEDFRRQKSAVDSRVIYEWKNPYLWAAKVNTIPLVHASSEKEPEYSWPWSRQPRSHLTDRRPSRSPERGSRRSDYEGI